ncbi:MAG: DNA gyrase inhibitor YacG [Leptothrix sp. (in: b-proteobacteria)]
MTPTTAAPPTGPLVPCPTCRKPTVYRRDNPFRPFCSERCKQIDIGAWANEDYRVEAPPPAPDDLKD